MVVEVYLKKEVEDITFVPISINYERLIEDLLFAREMLGIPKPKESTTVRNSFFSFRIELITTLFFVFS